MNELRIMMIGRISGSSEKNYWNITHVQLKDLLAMLTSTNENVLGVLNTPNGPKLVNIIGFTVIKGNETEPRARENETVMNIYTETSMLQKLMS